MSVSRQFLPTLQNGQKSNKSKGCKRKNVRHLLHSVLFIVLQKKVLLSCENRFSSMASLLSCRWIFSLTLTSINWPSKRRKTANVTTLRLTPCSQFWGKNEDLARVGVSSFYGQQYIQYYSRVKLIRSSFTTCLGGIDRVIGRIYMRLH